MHKIGLCCGDPRGIGPEIIAKSITNLINESHIQWQLFIPKSLLNTAYLQQYPGWRQLSNNGIYKNIHVQYIPEISPSEHQDAEIAFQSLEHACQAALSKKLSGIVTAPLSKNKLIASGLRFTDHTHFLADTCKCETRMAFYSPYFQLVLDSIHIPLADVPKQLSIKSLQKTLDTAYHFALQLDIKHARIAVAGLNPHAGENGHFGHEEITFISPAIEWANSRYPKASFQGPIPADTLFHQAYHKHFDVVVAIYHDQGLAPLKMIAFDSAVNITLGLPFIRTSPDHGTAFEIAHQNKANPHSWISACQLAARLCTKKNA